MAELRVVLAENLLASMLDLEVAAGNDALASHSAIRKTAKLMLQFIPGTDFIFSGYSAIPKRDNLCGGGNFDAEDFAVGVAYGDVHFGGAVERLANGGAREEGLFGSLGQQARDIGLRQIRRTHERSRPSGKQPRIDASGGSVIS